ncbi:FecCD family ABC transporter permease [Luteibaculum oceani]|uniref:FecCD family ABC transporter permease n=1 Tax=Luteibaculum oceani TaxID=1294296 RepID=UPI001CB8D71A|nr:iron ABC transporter permease [Luteibaculum oceani]
MGIWAHLSSGLFGIGLEDILSPEKISPQKLLVFKQFRLPKIMAAVLSGSAIATCGVLMQSYFRNALAGPFVLGVSSGASLGVAVFIMGAGAIGLGSTYFSHIGLIGSAMLGSAVVMSIILLAARRIQSSTNLLIVGLMWASFTSAMVSILEYFSGGSEIKYFLVWSMGSLLNVQLEDLKILLPIIAVGLGTALLNAKKLDALLLGKNYAISLGINFQRTSFLILATTCLLAGIITAYVGPLAFVGLAIPHFCRLILNTNVHQKLLRLAIVFGAVFMVWCQWVAENAISDIVLPINVITSLIGAPVVISIIKRSGK